MAIASDRFVIMLPPKTGSTWLRQALNNANVDWHDDGPEHGMPESELGDREQAVLVRGPVSWLRSYYCFRFEAPVRLYPDLDEIVDSQKNVGIKKPTRESFSSFIHDVVTLHPGFVSKMYWRYASHYGGSIYVIQTERLQESLIATLDGMGVEVDDGAVWNTPVINKSDLSKKSLVTQTVIKLVAEVEPMPIYPDGSSYEEWRQDVLSS